MTTFFSAFTDDEARCCGVKDQLQIASGSVCSVMSEANLQALRRNATSRTDYIMAHYYSNTLQMLVKFSGIINDEASYLAAKNGRSIS